MKIHNQYIIPLTGQKEGQHDFEFKIENEFFDEYPIIEASGGSLIADVKMMKKKTFLSFDVLLQGNIRLQCDRCLEYYDQDIEFKGSFFAKYSDNPEKEEISDDVIFIHHEEHEIDLKQYLYESISLSIPYKRVHPEVNGLPTCNKDMLKYINNYPENKDNLGTNPIWDKLKDLNI